VKIQTDGLILRETPVGEADKFVTILTRSHGILRAAARGARKTNSRLLAATRLLTHGQFLLQEGKNNLYLDDARPLTVFFSLREDLEKLTLGQYFCELAGAVAPREEPAEEALRLLLNTLHFLSNGERAPYLLKAVTELRLLSGAGYAPDLSACCRCGEQNGNYGFLPLEGRLVCAACDTNALPLSAQVLTALRRIQAGGLEHCFNITLSPKDCAALATVSEAFMKAQLGRSFPTLDFYNTLHN